MLNEKNKLIIITPVYEDLEAAKLLFTDLRKVLGTSIFLVVVDDGSIRQPVNVIILKEAGLDGLVIKLKRNVGHQRAIAIGLNYVSNELSNKVPVVLMDSDGEDLPVSISDLQKLLDDQEVDIVVAKRKKRVESINFRLFYFFYKILFKILSGRHISFGNFMILKPEAIKRIVAMQELWIHIAACVLNSRLRIAMISLDRGPRYAGKSKMNFVGLVLHGFKGLMVFAEDVLIRVGIACSIVATLSVLGGTVAIGLKILNYATPGWFSVSLGILLLVFLQTGALTLMTLMLTGVVRGGLAASVNYRDFIASVTNVQNTKPN